MEPDLKKPAEQPYQPDSLDYNRVQERSWKGYYRDYWSAYKGRVRGMLAGIMIGGLVGAGIGLAVAPAIAAIGVTVATAVGVCAGAGVLLGMDMYGSAGSAAASRAAGLAERHARMLDPVYKGNELAALDDKLMMDGRGHHFQFPEDRDKGKFYKWSSGLLGAVVGTGVGVLLGNSGILAGIELLEPIASIAGGAIAFGTLGLAFGIDRSNLKDVFNQVDFASWGKWRNGTNGPNLGREQFIGKEGEQGLAEHRLRRQASTFALEEEYHNRIFAGAVKGMFRGVAGGAVAGVLVGAAIGAGVFLIANSLEVAALGTITKLGMLGTAKIFSGLGALYAMKAFGDSGREAGAESVARAIDNEFERNHELRQRGITPARSTPPPEKFLNIKAALMMGAVGAGVGFMLSEVILTAPALAGLKLAADSAAIAATVIGGAFGAMYGIGSDSMRKVGQLTDWMYKKTYIVHNDPTSQPYVEPLVSKEQYHQIEGKQQATPQVTSDDMRRLEEQMRQRPQKNFEQAVLAKQQQTATPTL